MTYTDEQLKKTLAKMLPRTVCYGSPQGADGLCWRVPTYAGLYRSVSNTELLHLCWLVEETLTEYRSADYAELMRPISENYKRLYHATWQRRVVMLAKVKGIEI
ncbi:MAG: hypothetical protein WCI55_08035 [Armatimonadota bacterium]